MTDIAIRVENLGKRYRMGQYVGSGSQYRTLRESLTNAVSAPFRGLKYISQSAIRNSKSGDPQGVGSNLRPKTQDSRPKTIWALRDVSFEVKRGEVLGIIGRNGAGKSTLLKILTRITEPTEGRAELNGHVGSLLEVGTGFHSELTGRENVYLSGNILGMSKKEIDRKFDEIVDFSGIEKFIDTPVKRYSSGMSVRLGFAVAAHLEPEILLVDEVLAVGDINFRRKCLGKMRDVVGKGRTVLFVSHDMSSIRQLCQRVLWLDAGKIRDQGAADEITARYEAESYQQALTSDGRFNRLERDVRGNQFWVKWVELRDMESNLSRHFRYGDIIQLLIAMEGRAPADGYTVEWLLYNERGDYISHGSANPMCGVYFNRGVSMVKCTLGPIPLTNGQYRFRISARVWGLERWDDWENAATFTVVACDPYGTNHSFPAGTFVMNQEWSVVR